MPDVDTPAGPDEPRAPTPHRPPPPRPEFAVAPLRGDAGEASTPRAVTVARSSWYGAFAVLGGIAAATLLDLSDVRGALAATLAEQQPGAARHDVTDTVSLTLLVSAGVAAVLTVAALVGLHLLAGRRRVARMALAAIGAVSVAAAIGFWSLMADAGEATGGVLRWAPFGYAGLVLVGVAALFLPPVGRWLNR